MEIEENYRERRVQLNKPVQCEGNGNYYRKKRKIASMCEHLRGFSVQERFDPANPALRPRALVTRRTKEDREGHTQNPPGSGNGKCQSDRSKVIGGKLLIGQLAP